MDRRRFVALIGSALAAPRSPAQRLTRFELFVNLMTATALGLAVPRSILLRADRAIE